MSWKTRASEKLKLSKQTELQIFRGSNSMGKIRANLWFSAKVQSYLRKMRCQGGSWIYAHRSRTYWSCSQNEKDRLREGRQEPENHFWHFCRWARTEMSKGSAWYSIDRSGRESTYCIVYVSWHDPPESENASCLSVVSATMFSFPWHLSIPSISLFGCVPALWG